MPSKRSANIPALKYPAWYYLAGMIFCGFFPAILAFGPNGAPGVAVLVLIGNWCAIGAGRELLVRKLIREGRITADEVLASTAYFGSPAPGSRPE